MVGEKKKGHVSIVFLVRKIWGVVSVMESAYRVGQSSGGEIQFWTVSSVTMSSFGRFFMAALSHLSFIQITPHRGW
jgi:hypothetical protein